MVIYKITNKINGFIYIGLTTQTVEKRFKRHYIEALSRRRNNKPITYFHNALLFYGPENFTIETIDSANTIEELNKKEIFWIEKYNSNDREIGYNLTTGGKAGFRGESTKLKIGQKKKKTGKIPSCGRK